MGKLWFKNKTYGWGWVPASWQGWLVLLVYVVLEIGAAFLILPRRPQPTGVLLFVGVVAASTVGLVAVCYLTGEKPRWRWGEKGSGPK